MSLWEKLPLFARVAAAYFVFGVVWILLSDSLVQFLAATNVQHAWMQTYKGMAFIGLSAALIAWVVYHESRRRTLVRRLLGEVVSLAPDPVLVRYADDSQIVEINDRFADELGMARRELLGGNIDDLELELAERHHADLKQQLDESGEVLNYRQSLEGVSGEVAELLVSSRRVRLGDDELVCTVAKDVTQLEHAYDETIRAWARALELRDDETFAHTLRVTRTTLALADELGIDDEQIVHIRRGALLHDIGKIGVPDAILLKDGDLTDEEWEVVRRHPVYARDLLAPIDYLEPAITIPHRHHEKWDGSGYPDGLAGDEIPLAARIFAVVDVWDALRSDRPYRDAWEAQRVLEHLEQGKGSHFQPEIVEAFLGLGDERRRQLREVDTGAVLGAG